MTELSIDFIKYLTNRLIDLFSLITFIGIILSISTV
jgi:hypothetical protein